MIDSNSLESLKYIHSTNFLLFYRRLVKIGMSGKAGHINGSETIETP